MTSKSRKILDLNSRIKVIQMVEKDKLKVKNVCETFQIGKTQVYEILKRKEQLKQEWLLYKNNKYFQNLSAKNIPVSGPVLKKIAKEARTIISKRNCATSGWLNDFKRHHNVILKEDFHLDRADNPRKKGFNNEIKNSSGAHLNKQIDSAITVNSDVNIKIEKHYIGDNLREMNSNTLEKVDPISIEQTENNILVKNENIEGSLDSLSTIQSYQDALNIIQNIEGFSLQNNDLELHELISQARILVEARISNSW